MSSYYYDSVMLDNPMVFYPMDESNQGDGQTMLDISTFPASAHNGTYHGTPPVTDALPLVSGGGKGTVLGTSNYITIPALEAWSQSRESYQFTFECWFLLNGDHQGGIRLFQPITDSGPVPGNYVGIEDGKVIFRIANSTNIMEYPENTMVVHNLSETEISHHLMAMYDNGLMRLYIDSKLVGTLKASYKVNWNFQSTGFKVAGPSSGTITIDAISMFREALPESSIQRHYMLGRSTIGSQEIARRTKGHFFPIDDTDSQGTLDIDWPYDSEYKWPYWDKSHNVEISGNQLTLLDITSPDTVDDNMFFTDGALQMIAGSKLLSDDQSTFNNGLNLLENASFDVDVNGDNVPDNWTVETTIGGGGSVTLTEDSMSSQNAVLINVTSGTNGQYIGIKNTEKIAIKEIVVNDPGNPYGILPLKLPTPEPFDPTGGNPNKMVLAVDVKGTLSAQVFRARVRQWNGSTPLTDTYLPMTVGVSWVRRQASFDILANATLVQVQFEVVSNGSVTGAVFIDNAQLELGYTFNDYVDGWFRVSSTANMPRMSRSDVKDSGAYALKLECADGAATYMGVQSERLPADPDDVIYTRLSSYLPANDASRSIEIQYKWYDAAGTQIGATVTRSSTPTYGVWKPHWAAEKAPALTTAVQVSIIFKATSGVLALGKEVYFDNIYITELIGEAAQYLVVEEINRIASANMGAAGVGFYLADFHSTVDNKDFAIMSFDEEDIGISVVKKYDSTDAKHKIVLRHTYTGDDGNPAQYDQTIKELSGGDYNAWHYVLLYWEGEDFSVALDSGTWIIDGYSTSQYVPVHLTYDTELTVGAGLEGNSGLGTAIKNVKVFTEKPLVNDFVANQTSNGNYYLPLTNDININMKGYAEFIYNLMPLYDAVDDCKIEWGPVNNNVRFYGRTHRNLNLLTTAQAVPTGGHVSGSGATTLLTYVTEGMKVTWDGVSSGTAYTYNSPTTGILANEGEEFTVSANVVAGGTGTASIALQFRNAAQTSLLQINSSSLSPGNGGILTVTGIAPADTKYIRISVRSNGAPGVYNVFSQLGLWAGNDTTWSMPPEQLSDGGEPLPIVGGYCPSLTTTQYYLRAEFETDNAIYTPATLDYLSMTFLDNVKFKTKSAAHEIIPMGSYNVSSQSTPILNQFRRNGIEFRAKPPSKNLIVNGGFTYSVQGWTKWRDAWCTLERSTEEYVSGGSSLEVTALKDRAELTNRTGGSRNWFRLLPNDTGTNAFGYLSNAIAQTTGELKTSNGLPVVKVTKTTDGSSHYFGTTRTDGVRQPVGWAGIVYRVSLKVYKTVARPIVFRFDEFNASNALLGSSTYTLNTATTGEWETISLTSPGYGTSSTYAFFLMGNNSDGWLAGETFYVTDIQFEYSSYSNSDYSFDPYGLADGSQNPIVGLSGSTQYTLSSKLMAKGVATPSVSMRISWFDSSGNALGTNDTGNASPTATGWTTLSSTFTSPANTSYATLRYFVTNVAKGDHLYIDEIQLEAGSSVTVYEDNIPSGMYLNIDKGFMKPSVSDEGYMLNVPRQQRVGAIEQWIKYNDAPPAPGTTLTLLEKVRDFAYKSGVYYTSNGITFSNMTAVYLDGVSISSGTTQLEQYKWHHLVAIPSSWQYLYNYIKNPAVVGTTSWTASTNVTMAAEAIPSPGNNSALAMTWTSATPPTGNNFTVYTQPLSLNGNKYYTISFYAKSEATPRIPRLYVSWRDTGNTQLKTSLTVMENSTTLTGWTQYYATFYSPTSTDRAYVYIGFTDAVQNEKHYISAIMMANEPYLSPYFDGSTSPATWESTANNSRSMIPYYQPDNNICVDDNIYSKWFWNTSFNGVGQCNATYSNLTIHEDALSAQEVLNNYQDTLSRGTALAVSDNMSTGLPGSGVITDGSPWLISKPWAHYSGSA